MARSVSTDERAAIAAQHANHYVTLEIQNPDLSWVDVSSGLSGDGITADWLTSLTIQDQIDRNTLAFSAVLQRDVHTLSLAPLRTDSSLNRNGVGAYAPMLNLRRMWRVSVAVTPHGGTPAMRELARGYVTRIEVGDSDDAQIVASGSGIEQPILDCYIPVVRTYCQSGPLPVETVIQQLLDDNMGAGANLTDGGSGTLHSSGFTLVVPTYSPTFYINQGYRPAVGNLMDTITKLAQLAGMIVRSRYDASDLPALTLFQPNRNPSTHDWTIGPTEYTAMPSNALALDGVRTVLDLYYVDASLGQQHVTSPSTGTSDAITEFGVIYMRADIAGSVTLNATNAQAMADAMRSDLELPALQQSFTAPGFWFVDLYDWGQTLANGVHYDQDQDCGVTGYTHTFQNGFLSTAIEGRAKPAGRYRTWLQYASVPIVQDTYNQCVAKVTATSATTITVTVIASATNGTPTVTLTSVTGSASLASGPALNTPSPSGTVWVFTRGAALGGSGEAQFTADFSGNVSDTDLVSIPEQGRDTVYLASRARVIASDATSVTVRYAVADPYPQGSGSVTLTYQAQNTGTVTPASGATVTPNATITENAGTYVDYTITRPAFGTGTGRVTFTASAANRVSDSDAVDIPAQEKTAFGPNLQVSGVQSGTNYVITWSGDSVQLSIDGGAYASPPASPITVAMNAPGGAAKTYTFSGLKDGQTVTNTVTVPAQSGSTKPSASLVPSVSSNQIDDTTNPVTLTLGASNLPTTYTWTLVSGYTRANLPTTVASGSNASTPLSGSPTQSVTPSVKAPKWFVLRVTVGSDTYESAPIVVNPLLSFFNSAGVPIRGTPFTDGGYPATASTSDGLGLSGGAYDSRGYAINTHFNTSHHTMDNVPEGGTYGKASFTRLGYADRAGVGFTSTSQLNGAYSMPPSGIAGGWSRITVSTSDANDPAPGALLSSSGTLVTVSNFAVMMGGQSGASHWVAYSGGTCTGTAGFKNYIMAVDPTLDGGSVTYVAEILPSQSVNFSNRIYVGSITVASSGGGTAPAAGGCVAPETTILVTDGARIYQKRADQLRAGDLVWTRDEYASDGMDAYPVRRVERLEAEVRVAVSCADGRRTIVSANHRFKVADGWAEAQTLAPGDILIGNPAGVVSGVTMLDIGPVIKIAVHTAHTYVANDLLSHNIKMQ